MLIHNHEPIASSQVEPEFCTAEPSYLESSAAHRRWHWNVVCAGSLLLSDSLTILCCFTFSWFIRAGLRSQLWSQLNIRDVHFTRTAIVWILFVFFIAAEGLYTKRRTMWNEIGHTVKAVAVTTIVLAALAVFSFQPIMKFTPVLFMTMCLLVIALPLTRCFAKRLLFSCNLWRKRLLVLGAADTGVLALSGLCNDAVLGYQTVGFLDDDPEKIGNSLKISDKCSIKVLGPLHEAGYWVRQLKAEDVLIAMPGIEHYKLLTIISQLQPICESVLVVPQLWALPTMNVELDGFLRERVLLVKLSNNLAKPWNIWLKRLCDIILAALLIVVSLPLCLLVAAAIKFGSEGPVFFRQYRLGVRGKLFKCLKFRTMYVNSDSRLKNYLKAHPEAREELTAYAKLRNFDPRVTRIGGFLRRWSLDELPQLMNVLKGEMSLVGPRPYMPEERERIGEYLPIILSARPGMSGLWQVNGRNHLTFENRVQLEEWYVQHWGIWLDCIVLLKTVRAVFSSSSHTKHMTWSSDDPAERDQVRVIEEITLQGQ